MEIREDYINKSCKVGEIHIIINIHFSDKVTGQKIVFTPQRQVPSIFENLFPSANEANTK